MTQLLTILLRFPPFLWVLLTAGLVYMDYDDWKIDQYEPLIASIDGKKAELEQVRQTVTRIEEFQKRQDEKLKEVNDLADEFEKAKKSFPSGAALPELLRSLADITENLNMEFSSFKPETSAAEGFLQAAQIRVKLKGSYVQVMSFLDQVSSMTRVVNAESLDLKRDTVPSSEGSRTEKQFSDVEADILIKTYFLGQGA